MPCAQVPLAMDSYSDGQQSWLVIISAPLEVKLLRVDLQGALTPLSTPKASLAVVRELSILSHAGQPVKVKASIVCSPTWSGVSAVAAARVGGGGFRFECRGSVPKVHASRQRLPEGTCPGMCKGCWCMGL
jgi:hypothetical protein